LPGKIANKETGLGKLKKTAVIF